MRLDLVRLSSLCLLVSTAVGCDSSSSPEARAELRSVPLPAEFGEICDPRHMVVHALDGSCTDVGGWKAQPLFAGAGVPAGLQDYCRYEHVGTPTETEVLSFQSNYGAAVDCRVVLPQGEAISEEIGSDIDAWFGWFSGRIDPGVLDAAYPSAVRSTVDVAVVDTYPSHTPSNPRSNHGPAVMSVVHELACSDGAPCSVHVSSELGMPRTAEGLDTLRGGVVGLQSDVAAGVFAALESHASGGHDRLVINLSLGWEAELFGGSGPSDLEAPSQAVFDAIRVARCRGALIVASAGNASGLTCNEQALAPGLWETLPAPTPSECVALGVAQPVLEKASYAPLVHAVGGMRGPSETMPGTRDQGMPGLAGAATLVTVKSGPGLPSHVVLTGTSMSAAVASAAASLVWSFDPNLTASEVMQRVYTGGAYTGHTASFGLAGTPLGAVRRIDVCGAVEAACDDAAQPCGTLVDPLGCGDSATVGLSDLAAGLAAVVPAEPEETLFEPGSITCPDTACGGPDTVVYAAEGEVASCDSAQADPWRWLASPQPPKGGCQTCQLDLQVPDKPHAVLTINPDVATPTLMAVDVEIVDINTGKTFVYPMTEKDFYGNSVVVPLDKTEVTTYTLPFEIVDVDPREASVRMTFTDSNTTLDPLTIIR